MDADGMARERRKLVVSGAVLVVLLTASVVVLSPAAERFGRASPAVPSAADRSQAPAPTTAERGRALFLAKGCVSCHTLTIAGVTQGNRIGPDLMNLPAVAGTRKPGIAAEAYVRESLVEPQAFRVPGYSAEMPKLPLTEDDIDALVAFLLAPPTSR